MAGGKSTCSAASDRLLRALGEGPAPLNRVPISHSPLRKVPPHSPLRGVLALPLPTERSPPTLSTERGPCPPLTIFWLQLCPSIPRDQTGHEVALAGRCDGPSTSGCRHRGATPRAGACEGWGDQQELSTQFRVYPRTVLADLGHASGLAFVLYGCGEGEAGSGTPPPAPNPSLLGWSLTYRPGSYPPAGTFSSGTPGTGSGGPCPRGTGQPPPGTCGTGQSRSVTAQLHLPRGAGGLGCWPRPHL